MPEFKYSRIDDEILGFLERDDQARHVYIDFLSVLHDILIPYASKDDHSEMSYEDASKRLSELANNFSSGSRLRKVITANREIAELIRAKKDQKNIDRFLSDLIAEYNTIRVIRKKSGAEFALD